MGILDRIRGSSGTDQAGVQEAEQEQLSDDAARDELVDSGRTQEQLGPNDPDPRGQHREPEDHDANLNWLTSYRSIDSPAEVGVDTAKGPGYIGKYWKEYYEQFALTRASLKLFDDAVAEPGYRIRCEDTNGDRDEEMEEALRLWAQNCVIHAGEKHHDLSVLIERIPSRRRGKGTLFIEKVGTEADGDALAALMMLDPKTMDIHKRDNQNLLIQPDDDVDPDHPRTEDGTPAAYEQYASSTSPNKDSVRFTENDIIKLVYDADTGSAWGTSIFESIDDTIDALKKKKNDRDQAIRQSGWQHRIYSSQNWSQDEAVEFAKKHQDGDVSAEYGPEDEDDNPFAGRVDFVPDEVEVTVVDGDVPEIDSAIMDDVQEVFSVMPVSRFKIAYEEDINQFVVEPQQDKDDRKVHKEREYIKRKLQPVFEEKANELTNDDEYEGEVHFSIEPREDENPLRRESFPAENLQALMEAVANYKDSNAEMDLPVEALFELAGIDLKKFREKYDWDPDPLALDDEDDTTQAMDEIQTEAESGSETDAEAD